MKDKKNTRPEWSGDIKEIARACGCGYFTVSKVLAGDEFAASDELRGNIRRVTAAKLRLKAERLAEKATKIVLLAENLEN